MSITVYHMHALVLQALLSEFRLPESVSRSINRSLGGSQLIGAMGVYLSSVLLLSLLLTSCGGDESDGNGSAETPAPAASVLINGSAQKGPFIVGTDISIYGVNDHGSQNGLSVQTTTRSDNGDFVIETPWEGVSELVASGYYFDEISGDISPGMISLRAVSSPQFPESLVNINILTHLLGDRILALMTSGMSWGEASKTAYDEFTSTVELTTPGDLFSVDQLDIVGTANAGNAYLLYISSVFQKAASLRGTNSAAELTMLLTDIRIDLADDGALNNSPHLNDLISAEQAVDPDVVMRNLQNHYRDSINDLPNINLFLDTDHDGITNSIDDDDDDDGVNDDNDAFPYDPYRSVARQTSLISVSTDGRQSDSASHLPFMSDDGRIVIFSSAATNLVENDTNGTTDVFIRDRNSGLTLRLNDDRSGGEVADGFAAAISGDGRFIAYTSIDSNLVEDDTNGLRDLFLFDRDTLSNRRINISSEGDQANDEMMLWESVSMSDDGRFVCFESRASNLVSDDVEGYTDIFVHDRVNSTTVRVSVSTLGIGGNADSRHCSITDDGTKIVFWSAATNLISSDTNARSDVFLHNLETGVTSRISVFETGDEIQADSYIPSISGDGSIVAFSSSGAILVEDIDHFMDVYVLNLDSGQYTLVSQEKGSNKKSNPMAYTRVNSVSDTGAYVAFYSDSSGFSDEDVDSYNDVFVFNMSDGAIELVSASSEGDQTPEGCLLGGISGDGRYIAFQSEGNNLVPTDTNQTQDIFLATNPFN